MKQFIKIMLLAIMILNINIIINAEVEGMNLNEMIKHSNLIIVGKVQTLYPDKAEVEIIQTLKGDQSIKLLYYPIHTAFSCDVSNAIENETALLFLEEVHTKTEISKQQKENNIACEYYLTNFGRGRLPIKQINGSNFIIGYKKGTFFPKEIKKSSFKDENYPNSKLVKVKVTDIINFINKQNNTQVFTKVVD